MFPCSSSDLPEPRLARENRKEGRRSKFVQNFNRLGGEKDSDARAGEDVKGVEEEEERREGGR